LVRFVRSVFGIAKLGLYFAVGILELLFKRPATRVNRAEWLHQFCLRTARAMGIAVRLEGRFPERGAVISNHMGYLDIVSFAALHRVVFVSKIELESIPIIGWMTTMAGSVYVERGRGGSAARARDGIRATAEAGIPLVFFPEGTTTNGTTMLQFHSGILTQVRDAGEPVTAAFVSYRFTEDNGPDRSLQDDVSYWGDEVQLFPHIFRLLGLRGIEVTIRIANVPIAFSADVEDRKLTAEEARAAVMEVGCLRDALTTS
jgi:1-acyl-sn-glycerol-3-phosphate acyltransferase